MSIDFRQPSGTCPWCGAPIYLDYSQAEIKPPWAVHTCGCRQERVMALDHGTVATADIKRLEAKLDAVYVLVDRLVDYGKIEPTIQNLKNQLNEGRVATTFWPENKERPTVTPPEVDLILHYFHAMGYVAQVTRLLCEVAVKEGDPSIHEPMWRIEVDRKP